VSPFTAMRGLLRWGVLIFIGLVVLGLIFGRNGATPGASPVPSNGEATSSPTAVADLETPTASPSGTPTATPGVRRVLLTLTGQSSKNSRPFTVDGTWTLVWSYRGSSNFSVWLNDPGSGDPGDLLINVIGTTKGSQPMYYEGRHFLNVNGSGPWSVQVIEEPSFPSVPLPASFAGTEARNTRPLDLPSEWTVCWDYRGTSNFSVWVNDPAEFGAPGALLVNEIGNTKDCSPQYEGGTRYLNINGDGRWTVTVKVGQ
jgi:hypothetical protein